MKRVLILLSVFGLLLGACGGDDDKKVSSSDDDTTATTKAGDDATDSGDDGDGGNGGGGELKAALLEASDLPSGFKRTLAEERDPSDDEDSESSSEFCKELDKLDEDYPGEREAEANFERTTQAGGVYLNQQIARFKDDDEADDAFSAFEKGFANCKTFTQEDADGKMTGSFEKTDFAKAGDDTYGTVFKATQTSAEGENVTLEGHFVALREGEHIVLLVALGFGDKVTKAELESVAKKAVAKL